MRAPRAARDLVRELVGALLPVQCAGCLAWDQVLCPSCRALARRPPMNADVEGHRGPLPGVFLGDYGGALRRIVLSAKHSARTDLGEFLDDAGENLVVRACEVLGIGKAREWDAARESRPSSRVPRTEVWVVPAPSSWKRRMRGRQVALPIAIAVARGIASSARPGTRVAVVNAVRLRLGAGSQSGKAGAQRVVGRMGAMRALAVPRASIRVVAVDDVVTTGATIREMERVLGALDVVAALCRAGASS